MVHKLNECSNYDTALVTEGEHWHWRTSTLFKWTEILSFMQTPVFFFLLLAHLHLLFFFIYNRRHQIYVWVRGSQKFIQSIPCSDLQMWFHCSLERLDFIQPFLCYPRCMCGKCRMPVWTKRFQVICLKWLLSLSEFKFLRERIKKFSLTVFSFTLWL